MSEATLRRMKWLAFGVMIGGLLFACAVTPLVEHLATVTRTIPATVATTTENGRALVEMPFGYFNSSPGDKFVVKGSIDGQNGPIGVNTTVTVDASRGIATAELVLPKGDTPAQEWIARQGATQMELPPSTWLSTNMVCGGLVAFVVGLLFWISLRGRVADVDDPRAGAAASIDVARCGD